MYRTALLLLMYIFPLTSPAPIHVTVVSFSIGSPGIVSLEFRVPTPSVTIPLLIIKEEVELYPLTVHCIVTPAVSTEQRYTAVSLITIDF